MSDDVINKPFIDVSKYAHLDDEARAKAIKSAEINYYKAQLRKLSPEGDWDLAQINMQDVCAKYVILDPNKKLPASHILIEDYKTLVKEKYAEDTKLRELLLICTPSVVSLRAWLSNEKFNQATWTTIRNTGLFTAERRAAMISALYYRGMEKDTAAAKIWLQLSGDFVEKAEVTTESSVDKYREINKILHKKN